MDIKDFFNKYPINKSKFADSIGMNRSLLNQYINGIVTPSLKQLLRIQNGINQLGNDISDIGFYSERSVIPEVRNDMRVLFEIKTFTNQGEFTESEIYSFIDIIADFLRTNKMNILSITTQRAVQ